MTETLAGALERAARPRETRTILDLVARHAPELETRAGAPIDLERFTGVLLAELARTPQLYDCAPASLLVALIHAAQLGLEPGPLDGAYLVPADKEVALVLTHRGLVALACQSAQVRRITIGTVREGDVFAYRYGSRAFLDHTPSGPAGERDATHHYALAELANGGKPFEVVFPEDVAQARAVSAVKNSGPWVTDGDTMARKLALRRLAPLMPQAPAFTRALEVDEVPISASDAEDALAVPAPAGKAAP